MRIFEPFTQADPEISKKFGGTGPGLALSRGLARALGGDLVLKESAYGEGSVFVLSIPLVGTASSRNHGAATVLKGVD